MEKKARCIEVRTREGQTIFSLYLYDTQIASEDNPKKQLSQKQETKPETDKKKERDNGQQGDNQDEPRMTDAQKRYLFRILADRQIEGDQAYNHLKDLFKVDNLHEVTRTEASRAIENLLAEGNGGAQNGSPF